MFRSQPDYINRSTLDHTSCWQRNGSRTNINTQYNSWADPEGGQVVRTPSENHKNIGFPSNIDPDSLEITKLPSQHSMVGHIDTPAKRHFNGVSLAGRLWPTFSGISISSPSHQLKKKTKNVSVGPPWQNFLDPRMQLALGPNAFLVCCIPRKKNMVTIFSQGHVLGPLKSMFY